MSELVNAHKTAVNFRWQLLATASAIALIGSTFGVGEARAADDDSDQPSVWIELGGQLNRMEDGQENFTPVFPNSPARPSIFSPSQTFENLPLYSIDETGKVSFEPTGTNWVLSASVRYGRSGSDRNVRQQTNPKPFVGTVNGYTFTKYPIAAKFADTAVQNSERHLIADFQAGMDVGLGMFGSKNGSSILNFGVRFAQFSNQSNIALKSDPDWKFSYKYQYGFKIPQQAYHSNLASIEAARSFHGIGPSLSWNASAPFAGNTKDGEVSFDWGVNAAVLFGRQRAKIHHQTTGRDRTADYHHATRHVTYQPTPVNVTRARTVTVPNVGGFAGASFRIENVKVSAGYRADLFFGAMDGGIDAAKKENVGFYGPFASVSVGLGG